MFAAHFTNFAKMKPLMGKPYMMTGTLFGSLSFMFQTGAILGHYFGRRGDGFFLAFGVEGDHQAQGWALIVVQMQRNVVPFLEKVKTFNDLVIESERVRRYKDTGPEDTFIMRQMQQKVKLDVAYEENLEWLLMGAAFGVAYPDAVVALYNQSHAPFDAEKWKKFHDAGLHIPEAQEVIPWDEQSQNDVQMFTEYVHLNCPQYAEALGI